MYTYKQHWGSTGHCPCLREQTTLGLQHQTKQSKHCKSTLKYHVPWDHSSHSNVCSGWQTGNTSMYVTPPAPKTLKYSSTPLMNRNHPLNICTSTSMVFYRNCKPQPGVLSYSTAYPCLSYTIGELVRAHCWWFPHIWKATWCFFFSNAEQLETLKQRNKVQNHKSHHSKRGTAEFCCTNLSLTTSGS